MISPYLEQGPQSSRLDLMQIPEQNGQIYNLNIAGHDYPILSGKTHMLGRGNTDVKVNFVLPFSDPRVPSQMIGYQGILPQLVVFREKGRPDINIAWLRDRVAQSTPEGIVVVQNLITIGLEDLTPAQLRTYQIALEKRVVPHILLDKPDKFYRWIRRVADDNEDFAGRYQQHKLNPSYFPAQLPENSERETIIVPQIVVDLMSGLRSAIEAAPNERATLIQSLSSLASTQPLGLEQNVILSLIHHIKNSEVQQNINPSLKENLAKLGLSPADEYRVFAKSTDPNFRTEDGLPVEVVKIITNFISLAQLDKSEIDNLAANLRQAEEEAVNSELFPLIHTFRTMAEHSPRYRGRGSVKAFLEIENNRDLHQPPTDH